MKTEYIQTEFPVITDSCREAFRIRGRARGVLLVPLAQGEARPADGQDAQEFYPHAVNIATADTLVQICGIGQELALAIVAHRESFGPFDCAADLEVIPGIGTKTAEKIWSHQ